MLRFGFVSQPSAVAAALIEADETERQRLLREADAEQLAAVIVELGHRREPRAAAVLELIDLTVSDRGLRKAARRELHRLRSVGVQVPQLSIEVSNESRGAQALANEPRVSVSQAWATDFDPSGSRALWLLGERTLGGAWLAALLLNDQAGLHDLSLFMLGCAVLLLLVTVADRSLRRIGAVPPTERQPA